MVGCHLLDLSRRFLNVETRKFKPWSCRFFTDGG